MNFVAVDFETANPDLASICQIGLVRFRNGEVIDTYTSLINPEDYFDGMNIFIHGITENDVKHSPVFSDIYEETVQFLNSEEVVVSHTHFDRSAWNKTLERYSLPSPSIQWLDSAKVARRAWDKYARSGYGLSNVCKDLGIEFKHHDALEDARAAGMVLVKACNENGMKVEDWLVRVQKKIDNSAQAISCKREGNIDGELYGETIVFTGTLNMIRRDAADQAASAGCNVGTNVTKKTTLLIVGDQDIKKLRLGQSKSEKHIKAEKLITDGIPIRILSESDFIRITKSS